ncbi:MAG: hypothetical protein QOF78_2731 [Phycisphaerales bacterium]|jgi:muconate cycloisomerase|nr:hypothetical protein [Phycisphaerales bacterium]
MKITRIETIPVRVPIKPQLAIKSGRGGSHVTSPFLIVKVHTDEGLIGLGEASCTPRWSGEDQFTARHVIRTYFEPALVGMDPTKIQQCVGAYASLVRGNPFTKSAIEMALWDIAGKTAGKPVYALLSGNGEKVRAFVPTKWSVSGREPAVAAEIAQWAIAQGFKKMKVKVGTDPDADVARVKAVRVAVGPQAHLGVDANGGWPTAEIAAATIDRLREFNVYFIEQPVPEHDLFGMADVRKHAAPIPIVADESVYTVHDAQTLHRAAAADVFSIYVGKAGGIGQAQQIAAFAHQHRLSATIGSNLELGIGSAAMTHLGLASPGITADTYPCDIIGPFFYEDDILTEPQPIKPGEARVHERPGLGVELDEEKIEKYRVG